MNYKQVKTKNKLTYHWKKRNQTKISRTQLLLLLGRHFVWNTLGLLIYDWLLEWVPVTRFSGGSFTKRPMFVNMLLWGNTFKTYNNPTYPRTIALTPHYYKNIPLQNNSVSLFFRWILFKNLPTFGLYTK